jgi:isopenicillin N synthase-like dioxygenase
MPLPIIDVSRLSAGDAAPRRAVAAELHRACLDKGFFYVVGHGVPPGLIDAVLAQTRTFFAQPLQTKLAVDMKRSSCNRGYEPLRGQRLEADAPADLKEGFYLGLDLPPDDPRVRAQRFNRGPNLWPADLPGFRPTMRAYFAAMLDLGERLMAGLALALGLPEDHFAGFVREPLAGLRLLHYPPQPATAAPNEKGAGAHTDFGSLTLLLQDDIGGLQVWDAHSAAWSDAAPVAGAYVVNLGDIIARWTNDRYRSTLHRVINASGRERYSVPFFFAGNPDQLVECIPACLAAGEHPRYEVTTIEQHLQQMYRKTYG